MVVVTLASYDRQAQQALDGIRRYGIYFLPSAISGTYGFNMSRYTGPKAKRCRAVGANLYGNDKFDRLHKNYPPGQHGQARKKKSDFAHHLLEKQKIRWTYGLNERQFRNLYDEAARTKEATGTVLLKFLESRLDNIVFRSGLVASRDQARQFVSHGHVLVEGKKMTIPSARMWVGAKITFKEKSIEALKKISTGLTPVRPDWLTIDEKAYTIVVNAIPERDQIDQTFKENLVVEYYSRK